MDIPLETLMEFLESEGADTDNIVQLTKGDGCWVIHFAEGMGPLVKITAGLLWEDLEQE